MRTVTIENITDIVVDSLSEDTNPRLRVVLSSLIRHMHDFAREVRLTHEEWLLGIEFLSHAGKMTDGKRNEFILIADILGMESLVDAISHDAKEDETESAVLGPFYRPGAPMLPPGASISQRGERDGPSALLTGRITNTEGEPVANAVLNVWETGPEGLYEQQDPNQPEMNLRGRFKTNENGEYKIKAVRPVSYPIPFDGPAGDLLQWTGRHPYRPAHIHMVVEAPGYRKLISQIYDSADPYLDNDSVFSVKGTLIVDFEPAPADMTVNFLVEHDVILKKETQPASADILEPA